MLGQFDAEIQLPQRRLCARQLSGPVTLRRRIPSEIPGGNFARSFQPCNILSKEERAARSLAGGSAWRDEGKFRGAFLWVEINESEELKRSLSTSRRWNEFSELEGLGSWKMKVEQVLHYVIRFIVWVRFPLSFSFTARISSANSS